MPPSSNGKSPRPTSLAALDRRCRHAGPLIHLASIGRLELLRAFAAQIFVPVAVYDEVVVAGAGMAGSAEVKAATWIAVVSPQGTGVVEALEATGLHRGEAEAIAVAREREADIVVIDDRQGRATAEALGLRVVGTVGVLLAARQRGDLSALAPEIALVRESGLWLSQALVDRVLATVGESEP